MLANQTIQPAATNFTLTKTASVSSTTPGGTFFYTITIDNTGSNPLTVVLITDTLPNGLSLNGAVTSNLGSVTNTGSAVNLNLSPSGTVLPGSSMILTLPVALSQNFNGGSYLSMNTSDIRLLDNTGFAPGGNATMQTPIAVLTPPELLVSKQATQTLVTPGGTFDYVITIKNNGSPTTNPFTLTDTLPSSVTLNGTPSSSLGTVTNSGSGNQLNLSIAGSLGTGQTATVTIPVQVL